MCIINYYYTNKMEDNDYVRPPDESRYDTLTGPGSYMSNNQNRSREDEYNQNLERALMESRNDDLEKAMEESAMLYYMEQLKIIDEIENEQKETEQMWLEDESMIAFNNILKETFKNIKIQSIKLQKLDKNNHVLKLLLSFIENYERNAVMDKCSEEDKSKIMKELKNIRVPQIEVENLNLLL